MLEWTVSGWIISGLLGFVIGILVERYIGRIERRRRQVREVRNEMGNMAEETTKVIRIEKQTK